MLLMSNSTRGVVASNGRTHIFPFLGPGYTRRSGGRWSWDTRNGHFLVLMHAPSENDATVNAKYRIQCPGINQIPY